MRMNPLIRILAICSFLFMSTLFFVSPIYAGQSEPHSKDLSSLNAPADVTQGPTQDKGTSSAENGDSSLSNQEVEVSLSEQLKAFLSLDVMDIGKLDKTEDDQNYRAIFGIHVAL